MDLALLRRISPISAILTFALSFRLWRLDTPKGYIFDEIYYAKNAYSLISSGVELDQEGGSEFVVHPPLGKWLIGIGIKLFGNNEFGWRSSSALFGSASVLLIYLIAKRLFKSEFLALSAALLMAVDGLSLVMSRVALLDIFLMFFILLTFYFLLKENYWLTGIAIGLGVSTKWSAAFLIPVLLLLSLKIKELNLSQILKRGGQFILLPMAIYFTSWIGWFVSDKGWSRNSGSNPISSLWKYHLEILNFHANLVEKHSYSANPWSWLVLGRPTSFYYQSGTSCGAGECAQEILAMGTPLLWWSAIIAVAITLGFYINTSNRSAEIVLAGFAGTYLPWFIFQDRTMFYFYSISTLPFLILALVYCFDLLLKYGNYQRVIMLFIFVVAINFIYFLPVYIGIEIPYSQWLNRMWLPSWI
jgi:dolichyl-phosphate-mannose--protein O-mannosyl transferase